MNMIIKLFAIAAAALIAAPASAAMITYTLTGTGSGTIDGVAFSNQSFTVSGVGDTDDIYLVASNPSLPAVPLTPPSITIGGVAGTISGSTMFFASQTLQAAGFARPFFSFFDFSNAAFASYDLAGALGPTSVELFFVDSFGTDLGEVAFSDVSGLVFTASTDAIPEPATWTMLIGGFGLAGAALRQRAQTQSGFGQA